MQVVFGILEKKISEKINAPPPLSVYSVELKVHSNKRFPAIDGEYACKLNCRSPAAGGGTAYYALFPNY